MNARTSGNASRAFFSRAVIAVTAFCAVIQADVAVADAVTARKDIKQMGMEYTEQQFAKSAGMGDMAAVDLFLEAGMDVNSGGGAALGLAAGRGKTEMVKHLLAKGARPTSNSLQFARTRGYKDIEKILVDAGAKE